MKVWAFTLLAFSFLIGACSSRPPVKPESKNVEVSREAADEDCKELGPVEGRTMSAKGNFEEALEDLKKDAAFKGANYVQIKKSGAMGTAVRGTAFLCD